jgi:hypothetical protein
LAKAIGIKMDSRSLSASLLSIQKAPWGIFNAISIFYIWGKYITVQGKAYSKPYSQLVELRLEYRFLKLPTSAYSEYWCSSLEQRWLF